MGWGFAQKSKLTISFLLKCGVKYRFKKKKLAYVPFFFFF